MIVALDIEPTLEKALGPKAKAAGLTLEQYLHLLAEKDAAQPAFESRIQESIRLAEPLRGKVGTLTDRSLDLDLLYGNE